MPMYYGDPGSDVAINVMGRERWRDIQADLDAQFPKGRRRKSVICPITGEEVDTRFGLSRRAWELVEKGLKYEEHLEQGEPQTYYASSLWAYASFPRHPETGRAIEGPYGEGTSFSLLDFVLQLLGKGRSARSTNVSYHKSLDLPRLELEPVKSDRLDAVQLTPEQAEIVRRNGTLIDWALKNAYEKGLREGSSMLTKMATGELTIEQINELHLRREK